jgi:hypothetical protein
VDDCSTTQPVAATWNQSFAAITSIDVVSLRSNIGHQQALAAALSYIAQNTLPRSVVVMDADGEDLPSDVPRLLEAFDSAGEERVVFARRTRRSEGLVFTIFYHLYRIAHRILTGIPVEVGNFSVFPGTRLRGLVSDPALWRHYAATVVHGGIPSTLGPTSRGQRIEGRSRMSFASLVTHGLKAMTVFSDRIAARMLIAGVGMSLLLSTLTAAAFVLSAAFFVLSNRHHDATSTRDDTSAGLIRSVERVWPAG